MPSTLWVRVGHGVTPAGIGATYKFISCSTSHVQERLIAFYRDTPQRWQAGKAVGKGKTWN